MVAAMMMLMMLTRLRSGPFLFGLASRRGFSLTLGMLSIQGTVLCTSAIWRQMRWILLGGGCEWRRT